MVHATTLRPTALHTTVLHAATVLYFHASLETGQCSHLGPHRGANVGKLVRGSTWKKKVLEDLSTDQHTVAATVQILEFCGTLIFAQANLNFFLSTNFAQATKVWKK